MIWLWISPFLRPNLDLGPSLRRLSEPLQNWCSSQIPPGTYRELNLAMVCGLDPTPSLAIVFQQSGLYHLLVVSGGHLAFFVGLMAPLKTNRFLSWLIIVILTIYMLMCGAQPPVVRALLQWVVIQYRHQLGLHAHTTLITFYCGILCLSFFPTWIHSMSFWLSWLATLACQIVMVFHWPRSISLLVIHLILLPGLFSLGSAHPFSILNNWLFAPILSTLLLPLCFFTAIVPSLSFLSDGIWHFLITVLEPLNQLVTSTPAPFEIKYLIVHVVLVQILTWQGWIWWQRRF